MTSISSFGSQFTSPLQRLQSELTSQVSAGTIAASDQDALSAALEDIDEAMRSGAQADRTSGTRPSPSDMQSKLEDLISSQVDSGSLTSDQADELKELFASAMPSGGAGGPGGPGGPGGGPGGPGGPPPTEESEETSSTSSSSSSETDIQALLEEFMKSLQDALDKTSASYGADGRKSSLAASLVFDYQS
jgi:hypothetical protein